MISIGDQYLIPSGSGGRATSTSGTPTSGLRASCTSSTRAGILTSGLASSPITASTCGIAAAQNWRSSHLFRLETDPGSVDQISATTVVRIQFQPLLPSVDHFTITEHIFRDRSDLQGNSTICCTAWAAKFHVLSTKSYQHWWSHSQRLRQHLASRRKTWIKDVFFAARIQHELTVFRIQSRALHNHCPEIFPNQRTDRRWSNATGT